MTQDISAPHDSGYHYKLMRRAIDAVDGEENVSLDALAAQMGMSPSYMQRLFSRWVGVSPKRYQQYLKLDHARQLLRDHHTTFETALEMGLSGSGRLHDLFLTWEAMSPGTYAKGGAGLEISYGWFESPFGEALAMGTDKGLCGLAFCEEVGREAALRDMQARWPEARYAARSEALQSWVQAAFGGAGETKLALMGGPFQIKVWEALLAVPSGHVTTYSDIATAIGHPKAVRAVGTAVGRNPISWLIPCHRALRKSGELGGYHWGTPIKRTMLAYESAGRDAEAL